MASPATFVPIQQIFDIAQARSTLRVKIAQQRWPVLFNARASAALTAMGELILEIRGSQCAIIKIEVITERGRNGIKLDTSLRMLEEKPIQWETRTRNLDRAAPDTEIQINGDKIEIVTYVWVE